MTIPFFSIFTLCTELLVTAAVFFTIYRSFRTGIFPRFLAFAAMGYELIFNISYMVFRARERAEAPQQAMKAGEVVLAAFHGAFSFFMFLALIVFFIVAARAYTRGENYFRAHRMLTFTFLIAWTVSIISGIAFFVRLYVL